jgi:hypothetical protein
MTLLLLLATPLILALFLGALACSVGSAKRVMNYFCVAIAKSFFGVVLPVAVFFLSSALVPEWKGACEHGWIDCFHRAKLGLTPLVVWATVSLYAADICRIRSSPFIVMGVFTGAMVSSVCFVFGVVSGNIHAPGATASFLQTFSQSLTHNRFLLWLLVPLYTAAWYCWRAGQLMLQAQVRPLTYLWTMLGSSPFWIWSVVWSRNTYLSLPNVAPTGCFIVTAATRGHRRVVGPLVSFSHRGQIREANLQLLTFWRFEASWQQLAPSTHARFRRIYNRCGPTLARRLGSPWAADAAYLALKPLEILARVMLSIWSGKPTQILHCSEHTY